MIVDKNFKQLFSMPGDKSAFTKRELLRLLTAVADDVTESLPESAMVHDVVIDVQTATCNIYFAERHA